MDESVIFVKELRSADTDVCVFESETTSQENQKLKKQAKKRIQKPVAFVDLSEDLDIPNAQVTNDNVLQENDKIVTCSAKNANTNPESPKLKLECPVCLESMEHLEIKITHCGHIYCKKCLDTIVSKPSARCPKCRKKIIKSKIGPVYL